MSEHRVRSLPFRAIRMGAKSCLIKGLGTEEWIAVSDDVKRTLDYCREFRKIDAHASFICQQLKLDKEYLPALRDTLKGLHDEGLLIDLDELVAATPRASSDVVPDAIVVITSSRPELLQRCLQSHVAAYREHGRDPDLVIMDDSKSEELSIRNQEVVLGVHADLKPKSYFAGPPHKQLFASHLKALGFDDDVVEFTLFGRGQSVVNMTVGANRNCALLDTVGRRIVMVDDDTLGIAAAHPDVSEGIDFISHEEARDATFFSTRESVRSSYLWQPVDLIGKHSHVLGHAIKSLIGSSARVSIDRACDHIITALQTDRGAVLASMLGIAGDSGGYSGQWVIGAKGDTRERLWRDESTFRMAFATREVFAAAKRETITHSLTCHGTSVALANDSFLPPFLPQFANEDGFFGNLLSLCTDEAFFCHIPEALFHDSQHGRRYVDRPEFRASDLVIGFLTFSGPKPRGGPAYACEILGDRLQQIGSLPSGEFWRYAQEIAIELAGARLKTFENALEGSIRCPRYVREYLERQILETARNLTATNSIVPTELRNSGDIEESKRSSKRFTFLCGRMLSNWPRMLEASLGLRRRGITVSERLSS